MEGNFPDQWYQGVVSTNDLVQKINVFDLYSFILSDPNQDSKDLEDGIDISNMQISPNTSFLIFINKKDSSLWMLDVR